MSENVGDYDTKVFDALDGTGVNELVQQVEGTADWFRHSIVPGYALLFDRCECTRLDHPVVDLLSPVETPHAPEIIHESIFLAILVTFNYRKREFEVHVGTSTGGTVQVMRGGRFFVPKSVEALPNAIDEAVAYAQEIKDRLIPNQQKNSNINY